MRGTARLGLSAALAALLALTAAGCTRRQVIPGVVAGVGAAMVTSGAIYRATLDTDEPFGDTDGEVAGTTILLFGGIGLLVTGVVLSITFAHCESNDDCWASDVCELRSHTCISGEAARALRHRSAPAEDADEDEDDEDEAGHGDEAADEGDAEPEAEPAPTTDERPPYPY